jgi:hypothetical protein
VAQNECIEVNNQETEQSFSSHGQKAQAPVSTASRQTNQHVRFDFKSAAVRANLFKQDMEDDIREIQGAAAHLARAHSDKPVKLDLSLAIYVNKPAQGSGHERVVQLQPSSVVTNNDRAAKPKGITDCNLVLSAQRKINGGRSLFNRDLSAEMIQNEAPSVRSGARRLSILSRQSETNREPKSKAASRGHASILFRLSQKPRVNMDIFSNRESALSTKGPTLSRSHSVLERGRAVPQDKVSVLSRSISQLGQANKLRANRVAAKDRAAAQVTGFSPERNKRYAKGHEVLHEFLNEACEYTLRSGHKQLSQQERLLPKDDAVLNHVADPVAPSVRAGTSTSFLRMRDIIAHRFAQPTEGDGHQI